MAAEFVYASVALLVVLAFAYVLAHFLGSDPVLTVACTAIFHAARLEFRTFKEPTD